MKLDVASKKGLGPETPRETVTSLLFTHFPHLLLAPKSPLARSAARFVLAISALIASKFNSEQPGRYSICHVLRVSHTTFVATLEKTPT